MADAWLDSQVRGIGAKEDEGRGRDKVGLNGRLKALGQNGNPEPNPLE